MKLDHAGSNWMKLDQIGLHWLKLVPVKSDLKDSYTWLKLDELGSNGLKLVLNRSRSWTKSFLVLLILMF